MINVKQAQKYCYNYTAIENYNEAVSDNTQVWHLHHKKEIEECKNRSQLIQDGLYYDRPPEELIFLTSNEHRKLHNIFFGQSDNSFYKRPEYRNRMSEAKKGIVFSDEHKRRISESNKGRIVTEETKRKIREAHLKLKQNQLLKSFE